MQNLQEVRYGLWILQNYGWIERQKKDFMTGCEACEKRKLEG